MATPVLALENISKRFGSRLVVDNLTLEVSEGEIFGFLGPNGAGKSTTIRMLLSLVRPNSGDARLFGRSIRKSYPNYLSQVGALVESPDFYGNLSALANLKLLARLQQRDLVDEARCHEVLDLVGLGERAGDKVKTYSHGMRQRLGIAQAIMHRPSLLILDEPSSGLDPQGMHEMRRMIQGFAREEGMTVFLSSHLLHEVEQLCTSMAVLNEGKLLVAGPVQQFLSAEAATLTELQAEPLQLAHELLSSLPAVTEITEQEGRIRFRVDYADRPDVARALTEKGVQIYSLTPVSNLEDYFLSLFGTRGWT
ncbi:MAG: ABC transporter ATP-binding protein [Candidatus Neomarinimicrobiota bacterium]